MTARKPKAPSSGSASSSASETAREIQTHLRELRKSSRRRQRAGSGGGGAAADERDDALRLDKLRRTFGRLVEEGQFDPNRADGGKSGVDDGGGGGRDGDDDASAKWRSWLASGHEEYLLRLSEGVVAGRTSAARSFCGVAASCPARFVGASRGDSDGGGSEGAPMISERLLNRLLESAVKSRGCLEFGLDASGDDEEADDLRMEDAVLSLLDSEFVRPHRDVQYFVCKGLRQIALDLVGGLERAAAADKAGRDSGEDMNIGVDGQKAGEDDDEDSDADDDRKVVGSQERRGGRLARAERNAGVVAENLCRILLAMDQVPAIAEDLEDEEKYLFPPPVLSGDDGEGDDEDDSYGDGSGEDVTSSDSSEEEEEEEEEVADKGAKRSLPSKGGAKKRRRKMRLVAWQQPYKHRHAHQEAWLAALRLPCLPLRTQKLVLQHLSTYVLGVCPSPLRFAEYFTRSFQGGTGDNGSNSSSLVSILSLHGLFVLMLDHQLEYPRFYDSLYQLLHPRILYAKHRTRFLRLLSKSLLSNPMLPAYAGASFCKRLCRIALSGPPHGALFALALVGNLVRKHGECACLIHRGEKRGDGAQGTMEDVFVEDAGDLAKTRALESSLWELAALERHYHPAVATLAKSVGTEDDKSAPMHDVEDFLAHTYKSLFEQEKKRLGGSRGGVGSGMEKTKRKGARVSLTFVEPEGLFAKDDVFGDIFKKS